MFTAALSDKLNDTYVDFDFAFKHCENLRARLPVLDSLETISVVKKYLEEFNFTTLEVITYLKHALDSDYTKARIQYDELGILKFSVFVISDCIAKAIRFRSEFLNISDPICFCN